MAKVIIQNLELIVSNACNLNCEHCYNANHANITMNEEVIDTVFSQIKGIACLNFGSGDPTLAIDTLRYVFECIKKYHVSVDNIVFVTNGTIYSEEFLNLLDEIDVYLKKYCHPESSVILDISYDYYHLKEIYKLGLFNKFIRNVYRYKKTPFFRCFRRIGNKLFREGNAVNLGVDITVPLRPPEVIMTYEENDIPYIGPLVTIDIDGTITESNASFNNRKEKYNYGNIMESTILEILCGKRRIRVLRNYEFFNEMNRITNEYINYDE